MKDNPLLLAEVPQRLMQKFLKAVSSFYISAGHKHVGSQLYRANVGKCLCIFNLTKRNPHHKIGNWNFNPVTVENRFAITVTVMCLYLELP